MIEEGSNDFGFGVGFGFNCCKEVVASQMTLYPRGAKTTTFLHITC